MSSKISKGDTGVPYSACRQTVETLGGRDCCKDSESGNREELHVVPGLLEFCFGSDVVSVEGNRLVGGGGCWSLHGRQERDRGRDRAGR